MITYEKEVTFSQEDVRRFAELTGDLNPIHLDEAYAQKAGFKTCIVHGMFASSIFAGILAGDFPGEGSVLLSQSTTFRKPVLVNETYITKAWVKEQRVTSKGKTIYAFLASLDDMQGNIMLEAEIAIIK